jgi:hypothetical protein
LRELPRLRFVPTSIPADMRPSTNAIVRGVNAAINDLVLAMTQVLTEEEKSPKPKEEEKPLRLVFKGNLQKANRFFYKRGWFHGFPIIYPTEEAVAEMLTGADLPPDYIVAKILPRLGKATVQKIAINAVMVGPFPYPMRLIGLYTLWLWSYINSKFNCHPCSLSNCIQY